MQTPLRPHGYHCQAHGCCCCRCRASHTAGQGAAATLAAQHHHSLAGNPRIIIIKAAGPGHRANTTHQHRALRCVRPCGSPMRAAQRRVLRPADAHVHGCAGHVQVRGRGSASGTGVRAQQLPGGLQQHAVLRVRGQHLLWGEGVMHGGTAKACLLHGCRRSLHFMTHAVRQLQDTCARTHA